MNISDFNPPKWLKLTPDDYKRVLNREARRLTKHDRRRGGRYQVKEALVAVHNAFHNCNGTDPYDGMPLEGEQLKPISGSDRLDINFTCKKHLRRMPTVGHLHQEPIAEFEILSCQTHTAKNEMTADEYLPLQSSRVIERNNNKRITKTSNQRLYFQPNIWFNRNNE